MAPARLGTQLDETSFMKLNLKSSFIATLTAAITMLPSTEAGAEVRSLTLGINTTCVMGLGE